MLTAEREPVAGRTLAECRPVSGNSLAAPITWQTADKITIPAGDHVRLQFELQNARLYSFWIE